MLLACRKDVHDVLGAGEVVVSYTVQALVAMEL